MNRCLRSGGRYPSTRHTEVRVGGSDRESGAAPTRGSAPSMWRARSLAVGFALCALAPLARAGLFDDEEARKRIDATNQRVTQLSQQVDQLDQQLKSGGLMDLFNSIEQIKADISRLRGQIEVVTYEIEQSQKRQKDLYVDLDTRLRKLEGGGAASAPPDASTNVANATPASSAGAPGPTAGAFSPPSPSTGANAGVTPPVPVNAGALQTRSPTDITAEQRAYDAALDAFKRGDYPAAISGFGAFVKAYPRSPLAPSAQYWVGNAQYARKDYRASIASQRQLIQSYPDSPKVPDALLNIASAQADMGDAAAARKSLEELITKYPQSEAASKAKQRLGMR